MTTSHGSDWYEVLVDQTGCQPPKRVIVTSWQFATGIKGVDSLKLLTAAVESIEPKWNSDFGDFLSGEGPAVALQWVVLGESMHEVLLQKVKPIIAPHTGFTLTPEREHRRYYQMLTITSSGATAYIGYDLPTFALGQQSPYVGRVGEWPEALGRLQPDLELRPLVLEPGRSRQENLDVLVEQGAAYASDFVQAVLRGTSVKFDFDT